MFVPMLSDAQISAHRSVSHTYTHTHMHARKRVQGKHAAAVGNLLGRLHEHRSARPLTPPAARPESSTRSSSGAGLAGSGAEGDGHAGSQGERAAGGGDGNESPDMTPKPFLKRKSRKVVGSKIDWSHVKPRTVSRWAGRGKSGCCCGC
eukprot:1136125-Pelagomonas_calceolata.AAC.2